MTLSLRLPRSLAYGIGRLIAGAFFALDARGRRAVIANLDRIESHQGRARAPAELAAMARHTFENFGKYLVDFFRFNDISGSGMSKLVAVENERHLGEALDAGRGVIGITAHYGNWELGGALIAAKGVSITTVAFPQRIGKTESLFREQRAKRGLKVLPFGGAARSVMAALKRREFVAMLADRDFTPHHATISFFGRPARLPIAPARLSVLTGAAVLPAFLSREPGETFRMRFYPPIQPERHDSEMGIRERIRDCMELEISANPDQWYIFEKFWPDGR